MADITTRPDQTLRTRDKTDSKVDLLHPELLSRDFIQLVLHERNIITGEHDSRDRLTELYLRHIIPLPQRELPNSRWGRRMERIRPRQTRAGQTSYSCSSDSRGRQGLMVFDSSSSHTGSLRRNIPGEAAGFGGGTDRLKPPPSINLSNPVRRLTTSSSSCSSTVSVHAGPTGNGRPVSSSSVSLKREAESSVLSESSEVKKKIQHVTWP